MGSRLIRFSTALAVAIAVVGAMGPISPTPALAWCYVAPLSATLDWEWNGSDANMNWGSGDVAFDPINAGGRAVITGTKAPVLNASNDATAGWTARSRGNVAYNEAYGTSGPRYGGLYSWEDSYALRLAKDLRPCT